MSDTPAQCPRGGYSCGERGFLCDSCKSDAWDKRFALLIGRMDTLTEMLLDCGPGAKP